MKRVNKTYRETELLGKTPVVHPLIEKVARGISDWQSERDWVFHTDQAIRVIEVVAEQLGKEGYDMPQDYLRRIIWTDEPKPRQDDIRVGSRHDQWYDPSVTN